MLSERLKRIRHARGISQEDLSQAMSQLVSKQAISKYEKGDDVPSARVLLALSQALGVPTSTLLQEDTVCIEPLVCRSPAALGSRESERLRGILAFHLAEVVRLRALVSPGEVFDVPIRSLPGRTAEDVERSAERLRQEWRLGEEPITRMIDVLEGRGVAVCMCATDRPFDGFSAIARGVDGLAIGAAVLCSSHLTRERQRLNLAHELGHLVLAMEGDLDVEGAAWGFARAFLAPRERLLNDFGAVRRTISFEELALLKDRYGMSMRALLSRLRDLGVISDSVLKKASAQVEPADSGKPSELESPQWFRRTVLRATSEGLLDAEAASALLGEQIVRPERKRNQFVRLLASMPPEDRQPLLKDIDDDFERDDEWLNANLGGDEPA